MNNLRPDELASQAEIERYRNTDSKIEKGTKTLVGLGTGAAGLSLSSKILPFLSPYITPDVAMKGINKISPKLGDFLKKGMSQGLDLKEGLNFIKSNLNPKEKESQTAPNQTNIISQYSDRLNAFLDNHIKKGRSPLEAGALAQLDPDFKKVIKKMEEDHKSPFSSILESVFGSAQQPYKNQQIPQSNPQEQNQESQLQNNNSDQALLAALDKILKM